MAKAKGKNAKQPAHRGAPPRTDDAERLAAMRWLVMKIEQLCIELFVTDRDKFGRIEASLRAEVKALQAMAPVEGVAVDDCPDGYVLCRDGLCAPMCDGYNTVSSRAAAPRRKGR